MVLAAYLALVLSTPAAASSPTITFNGVTYGKHEAISGVWFTNFENSRFLKCDSSDCDSESLNDWAAIDCSPQVCAELDIAARQASGQRDPSNAPEGEFLVRFEGRVGLEKYPSRYIGDGQGRVLIERLLVVKVRQPSK